MDWLYSYWESLTWYRIGVGALMFIVSAVFSVLVAVIVIVRMPANYFSTHYQQDFLPDTPWLARWGAVIIKNLIGLVLIAAGVVMLIGPGQGVLTILVGLILMDIPGKRPLEARIIKRPTVLAAINKLRERYNKPPLIMD